MLSLLGAGQGQNGVSIPTFDFVIKTDNLSTGSSTNTQFALPLVSTGTYNFVVNWGDGTSNTITTWNQAQTIKTYSSIGTYNIKITGTLVGWVFNNAGDRLKLLSINRWGGMRLGTTQGNYFNGCANLVLTGVSDVLNLTGTTSLQACFRNCTSVTTINRLNEWNVSNVTNLSLMFANLSLFNQDISSWNTVSVINMQELFINCSVYNQPLNTWNLSNVTNISSMFQNCFVFNQPLNNWDVSKVTNMQSTFADARTFNQNISNWNTGAVNSMINTFGGARAFNQPLDSWNVSNVTRMDIMLASATAFNQPIGSWNTSAVTNMNNMFNSTTAFNQNIGAWNVSNVTNFTGFMANKTSATFSTTNLDAIYNGWSSRAVKPNLSITFGTAKYTAGSQAGKNILTGAPNNWTIVDGGI